MYPIVCQIKQSISELNNSVSSSLLHCISCEKQQLESENITGKIIVCHAPSSGLASAAQGAIAGGAKGIIFEQYNTDILGSQMFCEGHMPCVVVDKETIFRISESRR
jgi:hypothetical protein